MQCLKYGLVIAIGARAKHQLFFAIEAIEIVTPMAVGAHRLTRGAKGKGASTARYATIFA